jgi:hypothetical protein
MKTMPGEPVAFIILHARSLRPQPLDQQLRLKPQQRKGVSQDEGGQLQRPRQPGLLQHKPLARR